MTFSFKRMNAIFLKDWKELYKNSYIIFTMAIPLLFAALLGRTGTSDSSSLTIMPITLALVIAGVFVQAAMIAEEKEKNTLRGLLLSPASTAEIFVGKSLLTAIMTILVIIGSIYFSDFHVANLPIFSLLMAINLVFYISMGTILGLLSRTVMETTIIGMPIMFIFGMASMFVSMIKSEMILKLISYLPSELFASAWATLSQGDGDITSEVLVLLVWAVVSLVLTFVIYGKRRFDNR